MMRRTFLGALLGLVSGGTASAVPEQQSTRFPPVPNWRPSFSQPIERIADRIAYYTGGSRDFAIFRNGTCAILEPGLSDTESSDHAMKIMSDIFNFHPDMHPVQMDDGNILVRYNQPAANVVLHDLAKENWAEIESRHLDGLASSEVLITPLGQNIFDDFGKQALLGRAYMFMDAQDPQIVSLRRRT